MTRYKVTETSWDHNGTLTVTVTAPWPRTSATDQGARRAARAALTHARETRIYNVTLAPDVSLVYTVRVSR